MTLQEQIAVLHPTQVCTFALANLAASETATDIPIPGAVVNTWTFPCDGYIVGYTVNKSAAHTAGSLDFDIEVGGSSVVTIAADTTSVFGRFPVPSYPFSAGDTIGVTYTSDASLDALTVDVSVQVFVVLLDFDF